MDKYFENVNFVELLWKWKWYLMVVAIAAVVLAAIFSGPYFITPKFESTAVIYPSNIEPYSEESETEQLLQWINSREIKDNIIERFDLAEHYEIDTTSEKFYYLLLGEYDDNVSISKTQYESIEIEVLDKDPVQAKNMALAIVDLVSKKIRKIERSKAKEVLQISRKMLTEKKHEIDSVRMELRSLGKNYGVFDVEGQSQEVTEGYLKTIDGIRAQQNINMQGVEELKENLETKGGEFLIHKAYLEHLMERYSELKEDYEEAYTDLNKEYTYTNIVNKPRVADKKAYPIRWLIVFYTVVAAMLMALVTLSIIERRKK